MVSVAPTNRVLVGLSLVGTGACAEVKVPTVIVTPPAAMLTAGVAATGAITVYWALLLLLAPVDETVKDAALGAPPVASNTPADAVRTPAVLTVIVQLAQLGKTTKEPN